MMYDNSVLLRLDNTGKVITKNLDEEQLVYLIGEPTFINKFTLAYHIGLQTLQTIVEEELCQDGKELWVVSARDRVKKKIHPRRLTHAKISAKAVVIK